MPEMRVAVGSRVGLHARPAAILARAAAAAPVPVQIGKSPDELVNAGSMLSLMALGARRGDELVLHAEGDGAQQVLDQIAALLATDLDSTESTAHPGENGVSHG
jgi:phosphotransferase system HPr (HPr) family protein